jgi:hypothetical protein
VPDGPPEVLGEPLELLVFPEIAKKASSISSMQEPRQSIPVRGVLRFWDALYLIRQEVGDGYDRGIDSPEGQTPGSGAPAQRFSGRLTGDDRSVPS